MGREGLGQEAMGAKLRASLAEAWFWRVVDAGQYPLASQLGMTGTFATRVKLLCELGLRAEAITGFRDELTRVSEQLVARHEARVRERIGVRERHRLRCTAASAVGAGPRSLARFASGERTAPYADFRDSFLTCAPRVEDLRWFDPAWWTRAVPEELRRQARVAWERLPLHAAGVIEEGVGVLEALAQACEQGDREAIRCMGEDGDVRSAMQSLEKARVPNTGIDHFAEHTLETLCHVVLPFAHRMPEAVRAYERACALLTPGAEAQAQGRESGPAL